MCVCGVWCVICWYVLLCMCVCDCVTVCVCMGWHASAGHASDMQAELVNYVIRKNGNSGVLVYQGKAVLQAAR